VSLHADAHATLAAWVPPTPEQSTLRDRYQRHLEGAPDGMWRSAYPGHITAGALVIDDTGERVLLNLHRKAGRWFHFGGHCEPGDATLLGVAQREAREESGLTDLRFHPEPAQLDVHTVAFCGEHGDVDHLDVRYVAAAPADAEHAVSEESLAVRWWPVDALPDLEPAMHDLIRIARATLL
jgi:8-oxo-dGTP pyrophosphatase MutT (NUDIX family)